MTVADVPDTVAANVTGSPSIAGFGSMVNATLPEDKGGPVPMFFVSQPAVSTPPAMSTTTTPARPHGLTGRLTTNDRPNNSKVDMAWPPWMCVICSERLRPTSARVNAPQSGALAIKRNGPSKPPSRSLASEITQPEKAAVYDAPTIAEPHGVKQWAPRAVDPLWRWGRPNMPFPMQMSAGSDPNSPSPTCAA